MLIRELNRAYALLDTANASDDPDVLIKAIAEARDILEEVIPPEGETFTVIVAGNPIDGISLYGPMAANLFDYVDGEEIDRDFDDWASTKLRPYDPEAQAREERFPDC